MKWKECAKRKYPDISLSDCTVYDMYVENKNIIIKFDEYGFIVKDNKSPKRYRALEAQVIFENCNIENISIKYMKRIRGETDIIKDIELKKFLKKVSSRKWRFEFVQEYYSVTGALYIGRVHKRKKSFWCYIKLYFRDMTYYWNGIDYQYPVN